MLPDSKLRFRLGGSRLYQRPHVAWCLSQPRWRQEWFDCEKDLVPLRRPMTFVTLYRLENVAETVVVKREKGEDGEGTVYAASASEAETLIAAMYGRPAWVFVEVGGAQAKSSSPGGGMGPPLLWRLPGSTGLEAINRVGFRLQFTLDKSVLVNSVM